MQHQDYNYNHSEEMSCTLTFSQDAPGFIEADGVARLKQGTFDSGKVRGDIP